MMLRLCVLSSLALVLVSPFSARCESNGTAAGNNHLSVVAYDTGARQLAQARAAAPAKAPAPEIKSVQPADPIVGEKVTLNGERFAKTPREAAVSIGGKNAPVQSCSETSVVVIVPTDLKPGKHPIIIATNGVASKEFQVTVLGPAPELASLSLSSGAPGATLTISGKHFSPNAGENAVTIGGASAEVTSASSESLSVVIPTIDSPQYGVPVSVSVGKQKSKNHLSIDIQNREY